MAIERCLGGRGCLLICRLEPSGVGAGRKPAAMRIRVAQGERRHAHEVSILIRSTFNKADTFGQRKISKSIDSEHFRLVLPEGTLAWKLKIRVSVVQFRPWAPFAHSDRYNDGTSWHFRCAQLLCFKTARRVGTTLDFDSRDIRASDAKLTSVGLDCSGP